MMDKDEALKLAVEALELSAVTVDSFGVQRKTQQAITAIKAALAQPAQKSLKEMTEADFDAAHDIGQPAQEPVAHVIVIGDMVSVSTGSSGLKDLFELGNGAPLYTTPPAAQPAQEPVGEMQLSGIIEGLVIPVVPVELPIGTKLYTTPQPQEFVCSTDLCHFTLIQTNVGIGERGMEAYEAAKKRGWVGVSDERMMEMPKQEPVAMRYDYDGYGYKYIDSGSGSDWQTRIKDAEPIYTTPPQRPWVGLTQEEREEIESRPFSQNDWLWFYTYAIEAKLKEKNT